LAAVLDMVQAIETAQELSAGLNEAEFLGDKRAQWAVYSQIVILGEAAGRVDRLFQEAHSGIPWASIIGMRHRLVHGYDSVDWVRVWKTLQKDLPPLLRQLKALMPDVGSKGK
jgi:uncharacterized protein with HEPN domain